VTFDLNVWFGGSSRLYLAKFESQGQSSQSRDENASFSAMDAVNWLKSENEVGKISYGAVRENAGGNDTVSISLWRAGGMRCTECCCFSRLFVEFFVLKWPVQPQVRASSLVFFLTFYRLTDKRSSILQYWVALWSYCWTYETLHDMGSANELLHVL